MEFNFEIDRSSLVPLYAQLAQSIKTAIHSGALSYGEKLPSENEFMTRCGLSRMTVRSALAQLVTEKYIEKRQGTGAFVSYDNQQPAVSGSVDVLLNVTDIYFSSHYIKSISEILTQNNYQFVIHDTLDEQTQILAILNRILQRGSCGVIIQPTCREESLLPELRELLMRFSTNGIPYVIIDRAYENLPGVQLPFNDYGGGRVAAEYLVGLGHQNCAMVCSSAFCENQPRLDGFNSVLAEHGLPPLRTVERGSNLKENLVKLIKEDGVTAVYNFNDETALETMRILHRADIRIPEEVSVMGFDDTIITAATNPQLTSVIHPKDALGRMAAEKLISLVEKTSFVLNKEILEPRLHIRASCASPHQT